MRQEDKEVDGPDLERAEERKRETELVEEKEDELYDLDGLPEMSLDTKQSTTVLAAMKQILDGDRIVLNNIDLPQRQLVALEALKTAFEGKDQQLSQFVYAEDRRTLLEQALAVLQPEISTIQGAGEELEGLLAKVGELREKLNVLEDSEEELVGGRAFDYVEDGSETDDKPDDKDADKKPDNSDLDDPKRKPKAAKPKAKKGDEKTDEKTDKKAEKTDEDLSLTGPERPTEPKGPTTLGDPEEISQAAERSVPRWRRSGG